MARGTFRARNGTDRLLIRTICIHLVFFHEAGFEFRTQRRSGLRWIDSDDTLRPQDVSCSFNDGADPEHFAATAQLRAGYYKLSTEVLSLRRHCVWIDTGQPMPAEFVPGTLGADARAVRDVLIGFTYDGNVQTLRHAG
jgi:hypothetical protein